MKALGRPNGLPGRVTLGACATTTAIQRRARQRWGRTRVLALVMVLGFWWALDARAGPPITVTNALPKSTVCANGNTVSIFAPAQQVIPPGGQPVTVNGDFSNFPGLGVQVNNWYWTAVSLPVQKGDPQNPDRSVGQFAISVHWVLP